MTPIAPDNKNPYRNSIQNSYNRISGGTPIISSSSTIGPKLKSKTESALERYEAEKAVEERRKKDAIDEFYGPGTSEKYRIQGNMIVPINPPKKVSDYERGRGERLAQEAQRERDRQYIAGRAGVDYGKIFG